MDVVVPMPQLNPQTAVDLEQKEYEANVSHPAHYTSGSIECIDAMEAAFGIDEVISFCKLNAFKYIWRCGKKGVGMDIIDSEKASWYLDHANQLRKKKEKMK